MGDFGTVLWKELRDNQLRPRRGGRSGGAFTLVFYVFVLGVIVPSSAATDWTGVPAIAVAAAAAAMIVVTTVPDSFAGERDRKTLETLLSSRLPDRAILMGKLTAAAMTGLAMAVLVLIVSLITANVADHHQRFQMYSPLELLAALAAALLAGVLVASVGVVVSLRASSATAAARGMTLGLFALVFGLTALFATLPTAWKSDLERLARESGLESPVAVVAIGAGALIVVNAGLLALAARLFRRPRLIRQ
ncbi:MAG: ABC transporter permease [Actinomycetota bacterium]|nr:ABC transporter permease [Actinomycetota bacterium]